MTITAAMASQSTGIQQLLTAEKRAAEKVSEARKRKNRRLKQAKEEAQAEIDAYRSERERQYKDYEGKIFGSRGDMEASIDEGTKLKIQELNAMVQFSRDKSIHKLLELVYDIKPQLHQNLRI